MVLVNFSVDNKIHLATKVSLFIVNYGRELRMGVNIRKKVKIKKATKFAERMKKVQEKAEVALRKTWKEIKWQTDREKRETEE